MTSQQVPSIPWSLIVNNLEWRQSGLCKDKATDFHWTNKSNQARDIKRFVECFTSRIHEYARCEYEERETYAVPEEDEIVLSDDICKRIISTVRRWRLDLDQYDYPYDETSKIIICPHEYDEGSGDKPCKCALPRRERKMKAFLRPRTNNDCWEFYSKNEFSFFNLEIFKILLMHGEMDILLRIYSHPEQKLSAWWGAMACYCEGPDLGWEHVCKFALKAYLLLNIIQCFPQTWPKNQTSHQDYRDTEAYQATVHSLTKTGWNSEIARYPHRQFFGIVDGQFNVFWKHSKQNAAKLDSLYGGHYPLGLICYENLLKFEKDVGYVPSTSDIIETRRALQRKGLPLELADGIMDMAKYDKTIRQLAVAHDPFDPTNKNELNEHIQYCWNLLIRCELVSRVIRMDLKWEELVFNALTEIFSCDCGLPVTGP